MTKATLALALALAGCGRLGFQQADGRSGDGGPDASAGDLVTLVVTSDAYLSDVAGTPIAGATVLVERSGGTERSTTDATGTARFPAAGAIACHVVYQSDTGWRGYTVAAPPAGATIELGSRPASSPTHGMTFALPASANASQFIVQLPAHCATPAPSSTPSVAVPYDAACEGTQGRLIGYALSGATSPDLYIDAGPVALVNGATYTVPGSYQVLPGHSLSLANLPAATDSVTVEVLARSGLELTSLTPVPGTAVAQGGAAMLSVEAVPGGDALRVQVSAATPVAYLSTSERIAPVALAAPAATVDAGGMLPLIDSAMADGARAVSWTGGGGGTITVVEGIAGGVQWDLYLDPAATSAGVPDLPADLGVPTTGTVDFLSIVELDVPGATFAGLVPTIDRRWPSWPHDPLLLPPEGSAMSRLLYSRALGPPARAPAP